MARPLFSRSLGARASLVAGGLAIALGLVSVGAYVVGVIDVWEEPDRSWIFWGAGFGLGGLVLVQAGVAAIILGTALRRKEGAEARGEGSGGDAGDEEVSGVDPHAGDA